MPSPEMRQRSVHTRRHDIPTLIGQGVRDMITMTKNIDLSSTLFVLGAPDPEMAAIAKLLQETVPPCRVAGAMTCGTDGKWSPVHPGNAYKADHVGYYGLEGITTVVFVECALKDPDVLNWSATDENGQLGIVAVKPNVITIDHHRKGDPGYGKGPEEFLPASSIGQMLQLLWGGIPLVWRDNKWRQDVPSGTAHWSVGQEIVLTAAADHCLEHAYRGCCPGVDPDELMAWRAQSRAAFQSRPVEEVLRDIERARDILRSDMRQKCAFCGRQVAYGYCDDCAAQGYPNTPIRHPDYADLRGLNIPELPEAAAREGIPFLSEVQDRDGRRKVVLMAAPSELVRKFLAGGVVQSLVDYYGDPARGFAGGYLS